MAHQYTHKISLFLTCINIHGAKGEAWLTALPQLVADAAEHYGLSELKPMNNLTHNYVESGLQGDRPIVLKLGLDDTGLKREASALKSFAGLGAVEVLAQSDGLLLLERSVPGTDLVSHFPDREIESIKIAVDVMQRLHRANAPSDYQFPLMDDWLQSLDQAWPEIPEKYLNRARTLRDQLLATADRSSYVLLHGDLHYGNILRSGSAWTTIDPKGVRGEPACEVWPFIRNPIPNLLITPDLANVLTDRIALFAALIPCNHERLKHWCLVQSVLDWVWALEDGVDPSYFEKLAQILHAASEHQQ